MKPLITLKKMTDQHTNRPEELKANIRYEEEYDDEDCQLKFVLLNKRKPLLQLKTMTHRDKRET